MQDDSFHKDFQRFIDNIRREQDREDQERMLWKDDARAHFSSIRTSLETAGLDASYALSLARVDPTPSRQQDTFSYLQYRIALAYSNALETVQLFRGEKDPWKIAQILQVLAIFDNDACCHADELITLCDSWWGGS